MTMLRKTITRLLCFAAAVALPVALPAPSIADDASSVTVNYAKDIAPILNTNCVECHRPGQIGPMSLQNFKEVRPWAKSIRTSVQAKTMPPWFASEADRGKFKEERGLTEQQIALISDWVDQGARMGNPADLPEPPVFADGGWTIGEPDQIFTMTEPFKVKDEIVDYYHHTMIPANFDEDRWVKAIEIHPDARSVVHHILVFTMPPGADPTNVEANMDLLAGYGPGTNADVFAPGYGKKIPAGNNIVFQVHYHKEAGPGTSVFDQSSMGVIYADEAPKHPVTRAWILNPQIDLKPGDSDYELKSTFRFIDNGQILSLTPHMHLRGTAARFVAEYPDGTSETLLDVPRYDFNWQVMYHLKEPIDIPRGTKVHFYAEYDNSADNPYNPDPTRHIHWGDASTDEMMIGYMSYIYNKRKDFQRIVALPEGMLNAGWGDDHEHGGGHKHEWNQNTDGS
jgi:mono/diheme cytochrome c family protein